MFYEWLKVCKNTHTHKIMHRKIKMKNKSLMLNQQWNSENEEAAATFITQNTKGWQQQTGSGRTFVFANQNLQTKPAGPHGAKKQNSNTATWARVDHTDPVLQTCPQNMEVQNKLNSTREAARKPQQAVCKDHPEMKLSPLPTLTNTGRKRRRRSKAELGKNGRNTFNPIQLFQLYLLLWRWREHFDLPSRPPFKNTLLRNWIISNVSKCYRWSC